MGGVLNHLCFHIFIFLFITTISKSQSTTDCVYTIYVQTGPNIFDGTDSKISLTIYDKRDSGIYINNLASWGKMGPKYDYFEKGNTDIFVGTGLCLSGPVCKIKLTSDFSGGLPLWYCQSVSVASTGVNTTCSQQSFNVGTYFSPFWPFSLSTVKSKCPLKNGNEGKLCTPGSSGVSAM